MDREWLKLVREAINEYRSVTFHLPGEHDQSDHAPNGGGVEEPVSVVEGYQEEIGDKVVEGKLQIYEDGVRIFVQDNMDTDKQLYNPEMVHKAVSDMEPEIAKFVGRVNLYDFPSPHNEYYSKQFGKDFRAEASCNLATGDINFFENADFAGHLDTETMPDYIRNVMYHEAAHNLDSMAVHLHVDGASQSAEYERAMAGDYHEGPLKVEWVSSYAFVGQSTREDFADAVRMYYATPESREALQEYFPNRYDFIEEVLHTTPGMR